MHEFMNKLYFLAAFIFCVNCFTSCKNDDVTIPSEVADLVVYGNIYTSEEGSLHASAFAVKDGKYVYVGDKEGAQAYVGKETQVVEQPDGMVLPGCTEAHGHYITDAVFRQLLYLDPEASFSSQLTAIKDYYEANKVKVSQIIGFGWYELYLSEEELLSIRKQLDDITTEIPIFISDHEMHQAWVNTKALEDAGVKINDLGKDDRDETVVRGGTIFRHEGVATGRIQDQANGFVRQRALHDPMATATQYAEAGKAANRTLISMGYTNYLDAWLSYDNTDAAYRTFKELDDNGQLKMNVVGCYEIDSYKVNSDADYIALVKEALSWKSKYTSEHFFPNNIKLFADGCTESYTGYVFEPYPFTGNTGVKNWDETLFDNIVKYINDNGLIVHTHAYGDAAVNYVVNAYEKSYNSGNLMRNGLGHVGNVTNVDMERIQQYGISVAENFCWHAATTLYTVAEMVEYLGNKYLEMYPMKRFFDHKIPVASSTDAPCSVDFPSDPFGIMETMLTGFNPLSSAPEEQVYGRSELTDIHQAIQAMTINGAWALGMENERGSIKVGKFADFILIDTDLLNTPAGNLHNTKVCATYFEGDRVY